VNPFAYLASSQIQEPIGTGGFLDPESIVNLFGVREGMNIADFGCGAGYFTVSLAEKTGPTGKVYAFDIQENALDNVRAKASAHYLNNIETVRTNLEVAGSSGLPDDSQSIVLLANILFQSSKKQEIIREARRIAVKNGEVIIIDWKNGTGGFGPPNDLRKDSEEIKKMTEREGLTFERTINAGQFHFGLIFKKP